MKATLRQRTHDAIPSQGAYLRAVVRGHLNYYGVPRNGPALAAFRQGVGWHWRRALRRRSQQDHCTWERMQRHLARWLPLARICHPYPETRFAVTTRGRSRMR